MKLQKIAIAIFAICVYTSELVVYGRGLASHEPVVFVDGDDSSKDLFWSWPASILKAARCVSDSGQPYRVSLQLGEKKWKFLDQTVKILK